MEFTSRGGAKHDRRPHAIGERRQGLAQDVHESHGLGKQALQLWKDGRLLVCLKVHLLAADISPHEARGRQQFQLALNGADRAANVPHEFAQIVRLVGMTQEPPEHTPPRTAK